MKTIDELAQVLLTVDNRLSLDTLRSGEGLVVDDDLHRELYAAIVDVMLDDSTDNVSEAVDDEGGHFRVAGDDWVLAYQYEETGGVVWYNAFMEADGRLVF